jgi:alpha-D-ribose 1-methylphosphonate 5-triphosphate synthase subunit PhnI
MYKREGVVGVGVRVGRVDTVECEYVNEFRGSIESSLCGVSWGLTLSNP